MRNSPLVTYTRLSPNYSKRTHAIDTITIHHTAGAGTAAQIGANFQSPSRKASANYGIGNDGSIGLYVDEANRAWTSGGLDKNGKPIKVNGISGADNDQRAVTIEVSNSRAADPWPVSDKAYAALIELVADICQRNGIRKLLWKNDKSLVGQVDKQNMTVHQWFAATACPGPYLLARMGDIAEKVNAKLEEANKVYYETINDVPSYYKTAVQKAVNAGALQGDQGKLHLSEDLCRTLTVLDRLGMMG